MTIADLLYLVASLALSSELVWAAERRFVIVALVLIVLAAAATRVRRRGQRIVGLMAMVLLAAVAGAVGRQAQIPAPLVVTALGVFAALHLVWWQRPGVLVRAPQALLPLLGLVLAVLAGWDSPLARTPLALTLWSIAAWPVIAVLLPGRTWRWIVVAGGPALSLVAAALLARLHHRPQLLLDAVYAIPEHGEAGLGLAQVLLVACSVAPLVLEAPLLWRWWNLFAIAGLAATRGVLAIAGPWVEGWPWSAWVALVAFSVAVAIGFCGVLVTVRRPQMIHDVTMRTLALGCAAAAIPLVLYWEHPPASEELVPALVGVVTPLLLAYGLGFLVVLAGLVGDRHGGLVLRTVQVRIGWMRAAEGVRLASHDFVKNAWQAVAGDWRAWFASAGAVPLLIFAAAWPAVVRLDHHLLTLGLVPVAMVFAGLARHQLVAWALIHLAMAAGVIVVAGADLLLVPVAAAIALLVAWPFFRWPQLDPVWSYPATVLALAPLLFLLDDGTGLDALIAAGCVVLLANGLRRGPTRWILLAWTSLALAIFLYLWIPERDPYARIALAELDWLPEWLMVLERIPLLLLPLLVLWLGRSHGLGQWHGSSSFLRWALVTAALIAGCLWAIGYRPHTATGLGFWLLVLVALPVLGAEIGDRGRRAWRFPLFDGLALALAALLCAAAEGDRLLAEALAGGGLEVAGHRLVRAGALGETVVRLVRDLSVVAISVPVLIASIGVISQGRIGPVQRGIEVLRGTIAIRR